MSLQERPVLDRYVEAMKNERLEMLEACIKQEKDDEAWAANRVVKITRKLTWEASTPVVEQGRMVYAHGCTIAEALRALRAKVEGGQP